MTILFWLLAAALTLVALAFLLLPLRRALRRAVADGGSAAPDSPVLSVKRGRRWTAYGLLSAIPALTLGLYLYLGAPEIIEARQLLEAHGKRDVNAMLTALEDNLKTNPEDAEGWQALGQSYIALQRIDEAEVALAKALKLAPKEARYLSQYAEVLALASGKLEGRSLDLVSEALELNYEDEKALELAGLAAYQRQEWAQASHFWRRLLKRLPPESDFRQSIQAALADAENKAAQASGLGDRAKLQTAPKKSYPH